jgi:threonine/homoserine/homoserine lactone efflux protein
VFCQCAAKFLLVRLLGASYLLFLGIQSLRAAWFSREGEVAAPLSEPRLTPGRALRQGVVNDLANPKMAAFFISMLPQFAPNGGGTFVVFLLLGFLFCLLTFAWLAAYSVVVAGARHLLRRPVRRVIDALAGCVLIAFGARMAVQQR